MNKYAVTITIIWSLLIFKTSAQESSILLANYLNKIEIKYDVVFNYNANILKQVYCTSCTLQSNKKIETIIKDIENNYGFEIKKIAPKTYILLKPKYYTLFFKDSIYKTPIEGLNIYDKDSDKKWTTSSLGSITIVSKNIKTVWYKNNQYYTLKPQPKQVVYVNNNTIQLETVALEPYFITGFFKEKNGNFFIKPNSIESLPGYTNHDIIKGAQLLPQVKSPNESISNISIKGGNHDQNLFIWNGIKMFQAYHFFGLVSAFNENLIETIHVYDNATPANFGNNTAGVIALNNSSKRSKTNQYGLAIDFISTDAYAKVSTSKNTELKFSARKSITEFWDSPTYKNYSIKALQATNVIQQQNNSQNNIATNDEFNFFDTQLHFIWDITPKQKLQLYKFILNNKLTYSETQIEEQLTRDSQLSQNNTIVGLNYSHTLNLKHRLNYKSNFTKHIADGDNFLIEKGIANLQKNDITHFENELSYNYNNQEITLNAGLSHEYTKVTNSSFNFVTSFKREITQDDNTFAAFTQSNYKGKKVKGSFGVRAVYYDLLNTATIEPRFYITYKLLPQVEIGLRGEQKTQNISQVLDLENNFLGIENRRWFLANDSIAPMQKSKQIELISSYKTNRYFIDARLYHKTVSGITTNSQGFQNQGQFPNTFGDTNITGILAHMNYKNSFYNFWLSYNYAINKYRFNTLDPKEFFNNNHSYHNLNLGANFKFEKWKFSIATNFATGLPYTSPDEENPINTSGAFNKINFDAPNQERLPNYFSVDASLNYTLQLNNKRLIFTLGLLNISNHKNILSRYYILSQDMQNIELLEKEGITFTPNFAIKFKI